MEPDTRSRILDAAEKLLVLHGLDATTLRMITAGAQANLAAVNYHFGSKENLINELFKRRLDDLTGARMAALDKVKSTRQPTLESVLEAFVQPALSLASDRGGGSSFVRLLARAFAEHDQRLRRFVSDNYGHVLKEFAKVIAHLLPHLSKDALYWRLDFVSGALTYAMSDFGMIKKPVGITDEQHRRTAAEHFVRFAAAGLRAP